MKRIKLFEAFKIGDYNIRLANIEDYIQIKKICNQNREWLPFVMRVAIEDSIKRNEVIISEVGDKVIGFIHFHKRKDGVTTLHEIGVHKDYQRLGIARELISKLQRFFMFFIYSS